MHWMVAHVYVAFLALVAFSVIVGGIIISDEPASSNASVNTWNRAGGFMFSEGGVTPTSAGSNAGPTAPVASGAAGDYVAIQISTPSTGDVSSTLPDEWESLLTQLTQPTGGPETSEVSETGAYSFIPTGLISTVNPTRERTPEEEALYTYGNQVGALIRSFDESHSDMIIVLKDAYADRNNVPKREAAEQIGFDYEALGQQIAALADVPASVAPMHKAIAQSYQEAGKRMVEKLRTQTDEEFLAAMHAYNASALRFTNNFVALATYLSASGVKFATTDPGSVFTFTSF